MFPYKDDNPTFLTPFVVVALIAANVAVWIVFQGMGSEQRLAETVCTMGLIPGDLMHRLPIGHTFPVGNGINCEIDGGNAWYTLFTSMFLHGGWLHILGNMWFLWLFGNNVEDAMGHWRFVVFYLVCGLVAAGAQILSGPSSDAPMVGASGAISGVMGAYVVLYPRVRVHCIVWLIIFLFRITVEAWVMLGYWFLLQVVGAGVDPVGGVAVWAHIGGFSAGALLVFLFRNPTLLAKRDQLIAARAWQGYAA
ncbi:MAG TPA: rhomboid family intramembrane serine protease [Gemmatimonadales bacterium]|jgi:membrane associated rhomboid family serine protease|nr:rhomboid family intramembrane serine protease [Gemmatimonadales bacterium]